MSKNVKSFLYDTLIVVAFILGICAICGFVSTADNRAVCGILFAMSVATGFYAYNAEMHLHTTRHKANCTAITMSINSNTKRQIKIAG